jgi:hypothetical protein
MPQGFFCSPHIRVELGWVSILYDRLLIPLLQLKCDFMQHHENPMWDLVGSRIPVAAQSINQAWCPEYGDSFVILR